MQLSVIASTILHETVINKSHELYSIPSSTSIMKNREMVEKS